MENKATYKITILPSGEVISASRGGRLLDTLCENGVYVSAPCGGRGTCGKCKVKLIDGDSSGAAKDENGFILSCKAVVESDLTLEIPNYVGKTADGKINIPEGVALSGVVDIGTTVVSLKITSEDGEKVYSEVSEINPQGVYGADVLSRISACKEGKLSELTRLIREKIRDMIKGVIGDVSLKKLYVSANTTMLHILYGVDPAPIGTYPFTPVFTETKRIRGTELGISADEVCLLSSASAYIGADVTSGAVYLNMHKENSTAMLVDVGTNGEIILAHNQKFYAASSAAGPALEGACIECGMGGVSGAISRVSYDGLDISVKTVDEKAPVGICGSGLIDLIAILLDEKIIDNTGAFDYDSESPLSKHLIPDKFYITENVYLSSADVRQIQVAKAAVCAAIEAILDSVGLTEDDVERVYISGGLGNYMSLNAAYKIGLLPKAFKEKTVAVGNTALEGALMACKSDGAVEIIEDFSKRTEVIELSFSEAFRNKYVENMFF